MLMDSGATSHFCNDRRWFSKLHKIPTKSIRVGKKGRSIQASHAGVIVVETILSDLTPARLVLTDVLYSPECTQNILSTSRLDKLGFEIRTKAGVTKVYKGNKEVCFGSASSNGMKHLMCTPVRPSARLRERRTKNNTQQHQMMSLKEMMNLHNVLGHVCMEKIIKTVLVTEGLELPAGSRQRMDCVACDETKTKRAAFRNKHGARKGNTSGSSEEKSTGKTKRLHGRVHSDVKVMPTSVRGYRYFVIFVHEGSRHTTVVPIKRKSDVEAATKAYINNLNKMKGAGTISEFRSDGGGEFTSGLLQTWLREQGIKWTPSPARTPEANGIAERHIQTIMTKVRAMLRHAGQSHGYWCYAAESAAYLTNRTSHESTKRNKTPHELLTGEVPNLSNLVPWGCIGVQHIDKDVRPSGGMGKRGDYVRMLAYDVRHDVYIAADRNRAVKRSRIQKWYPDLFAFPVIDRPKLPEEVVQANLIPAQHVSHNIPSGADRFERSDDDDLVQQTRTAIRNNNRENKTETKTDQKRRSGRSNLGVPSQRFGLPEGAGLAGSEAILGEHLEHEEHIMQVTVAEIEDTPTTFAKAVTGKDSHNWIPAVLSELRSCLQENNTFALTTPPKNANIISSKWIFKKKPLANGSIRYKARLVARGFSQRKGVDYFFTFAPTLSLNSFRVLLAIASKHKMKLHSLDIVTAYLHGKLDHPAYLELPEGWEETATNAEKAFLKQPGEKALMLNKGLYGLKNAGYIWNKTFVSFLKEIGFKQLHTDTCLFVISRPTKLILALYTDDCAIAYHSSSDLNWVMHKLAEKFKFRDMGPLKLMLGVQIERDVWGNYSMSQENYIKRMAEKHNIKPTKRAKTAITAAVNLDDYSNSPQVPSTFYRAIIGSALYVAVATRPDIAYATSKLAGYSQDPRSIHMQQAKRLLQFLVNTSTTRLTFNPSHPEVQAFADASWKSCKQTGRSHSGHYIMLHGGPVTWKSKKQRIIADSSGHAEYISMAGVTKDIIYLVQLCAELGYIIQGPVPLHCDSTAAISTATKPGLTQRTRSIRLEYHIVREHIQNNLIRLVKINTNLNPSDLLTKPLDKEKTIRFMTAMNLLGVSSSDLPNDHALLFLEQKTTCMEEKSHTMNKRKRNDDTYSRQDKRRR